MLAPVTMMVLDPYLALVLLVALLPAALLARRVAGGRHAGMVFVAFYPASVIWCGLALAALVVPLAALLGIEAE